MKKVLMNINQILMNYKKIYSKNLLEVLFWSKNLKSRIL
jgi:hypothetical protein